MTRQPMITVLAGEPEYDAHRSMRPIADLLADRLGAAVEFRTPSQIPDEPDFAESSFGDLAVLDDTELLVIYTRFRVLPEAEMRALQRYLDRGGAVLGLRTASHAFHFAAESPWAGWNHSFGADVLGSPWISHHGHGSRTAVTVLPDAPAELIAGLPERFDVRSWLYRTDLADWATPILYGEPIDPESPPTPGPVAWFGEPQGRRTFYTSLGHVEDLEQEAVRTLLINAARWALASGADR